MPEQPEVLWRPPSDAIDTTCLGEFLRWLAARGLVFDDYDQLWEWSVSDLSDFWQAVWDFFDIRGSVPPTEVMSQDPMPDTRWFVGAQLNYAEHALAFDGSELALLGRSQTRGDLDLTFRDLRLAVGRARAGLRRLGVGRGDAVAAFVPNVPECVVVFLAAASLGATFASCSPEFGPHSVVQRFSQLRPKVVVAVDGYRHHGKRVPKRPAVEALQSALPTSHFVFLPYLDDEPIEGTIAWDDFMSEPGPLAFEQVDVDHPLYVLFSSGTTGLPKAIVHGHGRIVAEHLKVMGFHMDLKPGDRLLAPATTSWMVWNFGVSALMRGASIVCFDGDPLWPSPMELWRLADETKASTVNCGAAALLHTMKAGLRPGDQFALTNLRYVGSTGSPLPAEGFRWVYDAIKADVNLTSSSGGTDICSGFIGGSPLHEVVPGEMPCRYLGAPLDAFDPAGAPIRDEPGELVLTRPMPSMPVGFLGDPDKRVYRDAYFDVFPGIWRHGDWITITSRGTSIVSGRSDATLNRAGVRIGTSEIYSVVDADPRIDDSVVVHIEDDDGVGAGVLILIVSPAHGHAVDAGDEQRLRGRIRTELSPRHVPDEIHAVPCLPRTLTGKKLEVPIKKVLLGSDPAQVLSAGAVANPEAIEHLAALAARRTSPRAGSTR